MPRILMPCFYLPSQGQSLATLLLPISEVSRKVSFIEELREDKESLK